MKRLIYILPLLFFAQISFGQVIPQKITVLDAGGSGGSGNTKYVKQGTYTKVDSAGNVYTVSVDTTLLKDSIFAKAPLKALGDTLTLNTDSMPRLNYIGVTTGMLAANSLVPKSYVDSLHAAGGGGGGTWGSITGTLSSQTDLQSALNLKLDKSDSTLANRITANTSNIAANSTGINTINTGLNGGSSGQVLTKNSSTNHDYSWATVTSGGSANTNIGSGFRIAVNGTNNIKTLFNGFAVGIDSTSNTNGITLKADSTLLLTKLGAAALYQAIGTYVTATNTVTLTNKRWIPRVDSTTSSATPTINTDNVDIYKITAQSGSITSFTTNLTGTPNGGEILELQITGTAARSLSWGTAFVSSSVSLPVTTISTKTLTVIFQFYKSSSYGNNVWLCVNYY